MRWIYFISVFLHILAAMVWIGGTIFIVIVLVPAVRQREFAGIAAPLVRWSGMRFRWVGWPCFGVLAATGIANLLLRGFGWQELQSAEFWQSSFGYTLMIKLSLVVAILAVSALHDFFIGPRAAAAWQTNPAAAETKRLRWWAVHLARLNLLFALAAMALAIMLVRGAPF
ncbi:MAG: CopD family protein [Candidatus Binatia bacterium]